MKQRDFTKFLKNESGAVTVDWVVLTAAIVGIAIAVIVLISGGVESASEGINDELNTAGTFGNWFGGGDDLVGYTATTQDIYDNGYIDTQISSDQLSSYQTAYNIFIKDKSEDKLDYLAGSEAALIDSGFELDPEYTRAEEFQQIGEL